MRRIIDDTQEAVHAKGLSFRLLKASTESEFDAAFAALGQLYADGLIVGTAASPQAGI